MAAKKRKVGRPKGSKKVSKKRGKKRGKKRTIKSLPTRVQLNKTASQLLKLGNQVTDLARNLV